MKKLFLVLSLFISGLIYGQTYQIDSVATFKHIDDKTFKTVAEDLVIKIENGTITFGGSYDFKANFTDTLSSVLMERYIYAETYVVQNVKDTSDQRLMNIIYYDGRPQSVGILKKDNELTVFHIKNVLGDLWSISRRR